MSVNSNDSVHSHVCSTLDLATVNSQQAVQNCKNTQLGKLFSPTCMIHLSSRPYESILSYILIQPLYKKSMER